MAWTAVQTTGGNEWNKRKQPTNLYNKETKKNAERKVPLLNRPVDL